MRNRLTVIAAVAAALGAITASAPSASAAPMDIIKNYAFSGNSYPKGGWSEATLNFVEDSIEACDMGGKDGLRAVARVSWTGMVGSVIEVQDSDGSNGYGGCEGPVTFGGGPARGTAYTLQACMRDGATGALQLCGTVRGHWLID
jgi:hypothetical protein